MILRFALLSPLFLGASLTAQHAGPQPGESKPAGHEQHHRNHISGFIGGSHHEGENGATFGGEYAFRFTRRLSLGAEIEHAGGDFRDEVFTFPFIVDVYRGFKFASGPGWEAETKRIVGHNGEEEKERERKFVYRVGVHYEIPVKQRFTVTPNVSWDFSSQRTVMVYGVSFGFGF